MGSYPDGGCLESEVLLVVACGVEGGPPPLEGEGLKKSQRQMIIKQGKILECWIDRNETAVSI